MCRLSDKEVSRLLALLAEIQREDMRPVRRKYRIYNLCRRASFTLTNAARRERRRAGA